MRYHHLRRLQMSVVCVALLLLAACTTYDMPIQQDLASRTDLPAQLSTVDHAPANYRLHVMVREIEHTPHIVVELLAFGPLDVSMLEIAQLPFDPPTSDRTSPEWQQATQQQFERLEHSGVRMSYTLTGAASLPTVTLPPTSTPQADSAPLPVERFEVPPQNSFEFAMPVIHTDAGAWVSYRILLREHPGGASGVGGTFRIENNQIIR